MLEITIIMNREKHMLIITSKATGNTLLLYNSVETSGTAIYAMGEY